MSKVSVSHPTGKIKAHIVLPGSKSESNRLLIMQALLGNTFSISNLSTSRDTQLMQRALLTEETVVDVQDAGTCMRFLPAYFCLKNERKTVTGSPRMLERPIAPLVNALSEIGFDIRYAGIEGGVPLEIYPIKDLSRLSDEVYVEANISSQFISALMMIAPFLTKGLTIHFTTEITSLPYLEMTEQLLLKAGVKLVMSNSSIVIQPLTLNSSLEKEVAVDADWSAAAYWYSIVFLSQESELFLDGLRDNWTQGDRIMADWMKRFGVVTEFTQTGAWLRKVQVDYPKMMKLNFKDNPDLAQTMAVVFAAANVYATFSGIESLKIKETDRVEALQRELAKFNVRFDFSDMYDFYQLKGEFKLSESDIETYNDHRMAMSFAVLSMLGKVDIQSPEVVIKSYPEFWNHLKQAGFGVEFSS